MCLYGIIINRQMYFKDDFNFVRFIFVTDECCTHYTTPLLHVIPVSITNYFLLYSGDNRFIKMFILDM